MGIKIVRRIGIALLGLLLTLIVSIGALFLWAGTATDTSLLARGLVWGDRTADDWKRLPSRPVRAGSSAVRFELVTPDWLADLKIDDMPLDAYLEATHTTAFIVLHGDTLLYEGYFNGASKESVQTSFSMAKSFASTLVGIAIEEGHIASLDDPVTDYIPELGDRDPRFAEITIRHLITMASGLAFERVWSPWSDPSITYWGLDGRAAALNTEIAEPPGLRFHYNDYNPLLIGMVLERATGIHVAEYLETRLWQPMGAEADGSWSLDSERSGFEKMFVGVNGRAIDIAKLGWLFLNEGRNGDRQVVPAAWVEEATRSDTTTDPAARYQYGWWVDESRNPGAYYAEGDLCQFIYVDPDVDLVIVRHGIDCGGSYSIQLFGDIARWFEERIDG